MTGFCFPGSVNLNGVKAHIQPILTPRDKVYLRESVNCIELAITPVRITLFRNWISQHYKITDEYSVSGNNGQVQTITSQSLPREHCHLELVRTLKSETDTTNVELRRNGGIKKTEVRGSGELKTNIKLLVGRSGNLALGDEEINLTCQKSGSRYTLDINLRGAASSLMTSLDISRGQRVDIGEVVEKINLKSREINSKNIGIGEEKKKGTNIYNYFITLQ